MLTVAVLLSGSGRTLQNLLDLAAAGELPIRVGLVISSSKSAYGVERAAQAGIPTRVFRTRDLPGSAAYAQAIFDACRGAGVDLVVLAGFLKLLAPIPDDYQARVLNIHPSLIPSFCGKGFYGDRVHQAVLDAGVKLTGCTVHFVDDEFDHGPIVLQRAVPVLDDDDAHTLAARVFEAETLAYPEAIRLFAAGRLRLAGRRVQVSDS